MNRSDMKPGKVVQVRWPGETETHTGIVGQPSGKGWMVRFDGAKEETWVGEDYWFSHMVEVVPAVEITWLVYFGHGIQNWPSRSSAYRAVRRINASAYPETLRVLAEHGPARVVRVVRPVVAS